MTKYALFVLVLAFGGLMISGCPSNTPANNKAPANAPAANDAPANNAE